MQEKLDSTYDGKLCRQIGALEGTAMKEIRCQYMLYPRMPLRMADVMKALTSQRCEVISFLFFLNSVWKLCVGDILFLISSAKNLYSGSHAGAWPFSLFPTDGTFRA
jgi:hypothetical protein